MLCTKIISTLNYILRSYNKQRSDKQQAEDAIDMVAGQQRTQQMKPIERPDSSKKYVELYINKILNMAWSKICVLLDINF